MPNELRCADNLGRVSYRESAVRGLPVYVTFNGRVAALDGETGKELWSHVADNPTVVPKMLADDTWLYVLTSSSLTAIEGVSGRGAWRTALPFDSPSTAWEIARHGGMLLVRGAGRVYAYASIDGRLVWEARCSEITIPVVAP